MAAAAAVATMASSKALVLEITIISAKHLKNVNWRNGDLKPYATFYLDYSEPRQATRADDSGSTRPVWNERFAVPITRPVQESILTLEIFHSKPSETPKPLVGTVKFPLSQLLDSDESSCSTASSFSAVVRKLELIRPSGRPQGKVLVKLAVKESPLPQPMLDYINTPNYGHYYNPAPPPPPPPPPSARDYREFSPSPYGYADHYGYYSAYYPPPQLPPPPPPLSRPMYSRLPNYGLPVGPSAPVDLSLSSSYDHRPPPPALKTSSYPAPSGPSAPVDYSLPSATRGGSVAEVSSTLGGLSLDDESNYEKEKAADRGTYSYRREY